MGDSNGSAHGNSEPILGNVVIFKGLFSLYMDISAAGTCIVERKSRW